MPNLEILYHVLTTLPDNAVVWAILVSLVAALMVAMGLFFFIRHRTSYFTLKNSYTEVTND